MSRKEPSEYNGELLCAACGVGEQTGNTYKICTFPGVTCEESCARYDYGDIHLCRECEREGKNDEATER